MVWVFGVEFSRSTVVKLRINPLSDGSLLLCESRGAEYSLFGKMHISCEATIVVGPVACLDGLCK